MEGTANEIASLAPDIISIVVDNPTGSPQHVNVMFRMEGDIVKGIVTDAFVLDIMDDLYHLLKYVAV